ncbi:MAG: hypothetical protein WA635_00030 [Gallionella sp.]
MASFVGTLVLVVVVLTAGCSADTAKRTAYETLQNVHQQECLKNPSLNCEKRESYEDYERKRKDLESSE